MKVRQDNRAPIVDRHRLQSLARQYLQRLLTANPKGTDALSSVLMLTWRSCCLILSDTEWPYELCAQIKIRAVSSMSQHILYRLNYFPSQAEVQLEVSPLGSTAQTLRTWKPSTDWLGWRTWNLSQLEWNWDRLTVTYHASIGGKTARCGSGCKSTTCTDCKKYVESQVFLTMILGRLIRIVS